MSEFSFCESVATTGISPWHIRQLTEVGRKLGGGCDTESLCGRKMGWDLKVELTQHHLGHACRKCVAEYQRTTSETAIT